MNRRRKIKKRETNDIVIGEIMGGLGNQLFIIFTTIAYSLENGNDFYFKNIERVRRTYFDTNIYKNIKIYNDNLTGFKRYIEKNFNYEKIPKENKIILYGYYQSPKYFEKYKDDIIKKLDILSERVFLDYDGFLHFRIGDYKNIECHPICDISYYIKSLKDIEKNDNKKNKKFIYFFEEEDKEEINEKIKILKENFNNIIFEPIDTRIPDYKQMLSMTTIKYCIIANSSFSWWGAYLNDNKEKIIYHPNKWFAGSLKHYNISDLFPLDWERKKIEMNAYLLTLDKKSKRANFSSKIWVCVS